MTTRTTCAKLCPRLSRIESLEIRYGVDRSGLGTLEVAAESHVHSKSLEMLSLYASLLRHFFALREKPGAEQVS